MSTLTSLLSRDGVVSIDTIEQALQRQVLEGGELDTALLELCSVPENVLGAYRAATFQLPGVSRAQLERIPSSLLVQVPAALAREHRVLPIAFDNQMLVLATDTPLPPADVQRLSRELGVPLQFRIATELRIEVALGQHYDAELPSRLRLLHERLRERDPGALCEVRPWSSTPPTSASTSTTPSTPDPSPVPSAPEPPPPRLPRATPSSPVRVMQVVTLGDTSSRSTPAPPTASREVPAVAAAERSKIAAAPVPAATQRRAELTIPISGGSFTREQVITLLAQAADRDRVLELFFSFACQYFRCTLLFALRDERLLGLEGIGPTGKKDLRSLEVPLARGSRVQTVLRSRSPRVLNLRAHALDRGMIEAIERVQAQPCALIPVAIRQRVVLLLYGDREGAPIAIAELSDLIAILPAVAGAFERIINERKQPAVKAQERAPRSLPTATENAPPEGTFRPSSVPPRPAPEPFDTVPLVPGVASFDAGPKVSFEPDPGRESKPRVKRPAATVLGLRGDAPPPPQLPAEARAGVNLDDVVDRPTIRLASDQIEAGLSARPGRSTKRGRYSRSDVPTDNVARRRDQETTRPERPSKIPSARRASMPEPLPPDPPPPRTLSQPPPGMGSYAVRDPLPDAKVRPVPRTQQTIPGREPLLTRGSRPDPRRERGGPNERERGEPAKDRDVVNISSTVRESLRAPKAEPARQAPDAAAAELAAEAERLVEDLCRCGPDDEKPVVASLMRLGRPALVALQRRFPGPLWFDRNKLRQRMPQGRDVSALGRALYAFGELAVPHITELLAAPQVEVRLCATLLAADRVTSELLRPLSQRLFDPDGQVRWIALETLPLYRKVSSFAELQQSLREKSADEREPVAARVSALEAIGVLRDPGSVELLAKLASHQNRQLSVPAHRSLVAISGQDFGDSERKWKNWLDKNRARHRAEWLIEALMHADERLRNIAGIELQKLTQLYYGYVASAAKRERERVQRRYREWWETKGRGQFGA